MGKKRKHLHPNEPLRHPDHPRPVTRRDFIRQGFMSGTGLVMSGGIFSLFANPRQVQAALSSDIQDLASSICPVGGGSRPNLPVICFDLAGGANIAGSNVLAGGQGGQRDFLSTAGYSKLGLPDTMLPNDTTFINSELGLEFHTQSQMLVGILEKTDLTLTRPKINGVVIPARSDNDTGNNPHNPMYAIAKAFQANNRDGNVVSLIGSRNSDSGGNSTYPPIFMNPELRPSKVDRTSDVTGMLDTGDLTAILNGEDVKAVMESITRLSYGKLGKVETLVTRDAVIKDLVRCGYLGAADIADRFAGVNVDPASDIRIVGDDATSIFTDNEFNVSRDRGEFRKTASVMKMVLEGYAGAGTITMGGFDYHTGERTTGDARDLRAGRCIGACLDYARRIGQPLLIYVFSDGSVSSNGNPDAAANGKGEWTTDNSSTAASFMLLYDHNAAARPTLLTPTNQIGWFSRDASVVRNSSPAADNVNLLVNTVLLNYMSASGMLDGGMTPFEQIYTSLNIPHGINDFNSVRSLATVS